MRSRSLIPRSLRSPPVVVAVLAGLLVLDPCRAFAQERALVPVPLVPVQPGRTVDRVVVRFISPETGGAARARFFTERELGFFARVEALIEQVSVEGDAYPERYVRAATDRLVARAMLASLMVQRGSEPPDLPRLTLDARAELADRIGGAEVLAEALQREGIDEAELVIFLRDQVRAGWYIDRAVTPVLAVTDDSLREAYRATLHPFRTQKFEEAKVRLKRWLVAERMRAAELEFLQSARARIKIATVAPLPPPRSGPPGSGPPGSGPPQ